MQVIFDAEDNGDYELINKFNSLINTAIEYGGCEIENLKVVSNKDGISIYDKVNNEMTYVKIVDNKFCLSTE